MGYLKCLYLYHNRKTRDLNLDSCQNSNVDICQIAIIQQWDIQSVNTTKIYIVLVGDCLQNLLLFLMMSRNKRYYFRNRKLGEVPDIATR